MKSQYFQGVRESFHWGKGRCVSIFFWEEEVAHFLFSEENIPLLFCKASCKSKFFPVSAFFCCCIHILLQCLPIVFHLLLRCASPVLRKLICNFVTWKFSWSFVYCQMILGELSTLTRLMTVLASFSQPLLM